MYTLRSMYTKLVELDITYVVPERISLDQTIELIQSFLSESSGGDRGLSVATALFETFGEFFGLYSKVNRYAVNASDESTGMAGDIECIGHDGKLKLAIEVKERNLTLTDVKLAVLKARKFSLGESLLNVPGTDPTEKSEINVVIDKTWAAGTNLYRIDIEELIKVGLFLTGEEGRKSFLRNIGDQLDTFGTQPTNRVRWRQLLQNL